MICSLFCFAYKEWAWMGWNIVVIYSLFLFEVSVAARRDQKCYVDQFECIYFLMKTTLIQYI